MHTICLLSLKGGAGKSTVVQSLAVCAVQHGQKTLVVELDPQGTLKNWSKRREAEEPRILQTLPQSLGDVLEEARQDEVNWVFLDTPGHNASTAAAAAEFADIILIPCKIQSVKDFDSVMASLAEANRVNKPAYVLMTQVPPNAHRFVRKRQVEIQQHYDVAVLSKFLSRRADFEYCDAKGLSASELNPDGEADHEINRLYALIQSIFIMHRNKSDQTGQSVAVPREVTLPDEQIQTEKLEGKAERTAEQKAEQTERTFAQNAQKEPAFGLPAPSASVAPISLADFAVQSRSVQALPEVAEEQPEETLDDPMDIPSFVKSYNRLRADK